MPSSVSDGVRPSAARMRSYSSAVMLCCGEQLRGDGGWLRNDCGGGSWSSRLPSLSHEGTLRVRQTCFGRAAQEKSDGADCRGFGLRGGVRRVANERKAMRYFGSRSPPEAGMAELADAADSKSADPCGHGGSTPPPGTNPRPLNLSSPAGPFFAVYPVPRTERMRESGPVCRIS